MALWRLAPTGEERPGWPKQIANWTTDPALAGLPSTATAIAADPLGGVVVVGVLGEGATP